MSEAWARMEYEERVDTTWRVYKLDVASEAYGEALGDLATLEGLILKLHSTVKTEAPPGTIPDLPARRVAAWEDVEEVVEE